MICQNALKNLLTVCERYRNREIEIEELKTSVWETARMITDVQEQGLRNFLRQAEGELDMIQFTCENIFEESLEIISGLTEKIASAIEDDSATVTGNEREMSMNNGDIRIWIEPDTGFFIRATAESGDPVRLSGEGARKLAEALAIMADRADEIGNVHQAAV